MRAALAAHLPGTRIKPARYHHGMSVSTTTHSTVTLDHRFCGPPDSGNGGVSAGLVADALEGACEITLRAPPPLGRPMQLSRDGDNVLLTCGEHTIATGKSKPLAHPTFDAPPLSSPDYAAALAAQPGYAGFERHNFPGCFVCGPAREEGDGLRIFAAPLGTGVVAAWQPDASLTDDGEVVAPRFVHAALDCPSYFALGDTQLVALLGRMHSELIAPLRVGEPTVICAWPVSRDGRKYQSAVVMTGEDGRTVARALNTWIEIDGEVPGPPVTARS